MRHFTQGRSPFLVRLACVRHAASVRSEPGSNSPVKSFNPPLGGGLTVEYDSCAQWLYGNPKPSLLINGSCYYLVFKDLRTLLGNEQSMVIGKSTRLVKSGRRKTLITHPPQLEQYDSYPPPTLDGPILGTENPYP